jgi:hypothetical protein
MMIYGLSREENKKKPRQVRGICQGGVGCDALVITNRVLPRGGQLPDGYSPLA